MTRSLFIPHPNSVKFRPLEHLSIETIHILTRLNNKASMRVQLAHLRLRPCAKMIGTARRARCGGVSDTGSHELQYGVNALERGQKRGPNIFYDHVNICDQNILFHSDSDSDSGLPSSAVR